MYKLSENIIIKKRENIYFGLNIIEGTTYEMNETQYEIMNFFKEEYKSFNEAIQYFSKIYNIKASEIHEDINFSISQMLNEGVLITSTKK